jgi:hypothetical protein
VTDAAAIIAYGYDLTDNPRFTGGARPPWWNELKPLHGNLLDRLTEAHRASGRPDVPDPEGSVDEAAGGVFLENYGSDSEERYILAVRSLTTYHMSTMALPEALAVPDGAEDILAWAAEALDLDVAETAPGWHLAAWLGLF